MTHTYTDRHVELELERPALDADLCIVVIATCRITHGADGSHIDVASLSRGDIALSAEERRDAEERAWEAYCLDPEEEDRDAA